MVAVKLPFPLVSKSPLFNFILCPEFYSVPFLLFGLTVPQQFIVLICKSSNNAGDENRLSTYNSCLTCSILAANPVTVACVAVMEGVAHFLSLPKYTVISIPYGITQLVVLYPKPLVFLWYILFEDDSTFEGHNDFINCKMFGLSVIFSK